MTGHTPSVLAQTQVAVALPFAVSVVFPVFLCLSFCILRALELGSVRERQNIGRTHNKVRRCGQGEGR